VDTFKSTLQEYHAPQASSSLWTYKGRLHSWLILMD